MYESASHKFLKQFVRAVKCSINLRGQTFKRGNNSELTIVLSSSC